MNKDNIFNIDGFYPTGKSLINKMLSEINFREVTTILEPSAGSGNIAEEVLERMKAAQYNSYCGDKKKYDIDCIEINESLRSILKCKGFRVVYDDFLLYEDFKRYDLIILNPPFENGEKHLLKCLDMQSRGGKICCILNAQSLKNPYSNTRKDLMRKLTECNATIEYLQEEFTESERKTNVEIALIKINIEKSNKQSIIIENLKKEEQHQQENKYKNDSLIQGDFIEGIIQQYQFEVKAGLNFINEFENLKPLILKDFKKDAYSSSILHLEIDGGKYDKCNDTLVNAYIKKVRYKYWSVLFSNENFTALLTTNLLHEYREKITELIDYDFSFFNIKEIQIQMNQNLIKGVEETILTLFDEFSSKHYWNQDSKNIRYFNGWKTNKSWKISNKVITMLSAYSTWSDSFELTGKVMDKIKDIEKVMNYLDGGLTKEMNLKEIFEEAQKSHQTSNIITKYAKITFYKKGTTHITFTNEELLAKFNLFGSQKKGWLPPSYGKAKYEDMTSEEKNVIDEFEGEESYSKVMKNLDYYIYNPSKTLMLEQ